MIALTCRSFKMWVDGWVHLALIGIAHLHIPACSAEADIAGDSTSRTPIAGADVRGGCATTSGRKRAGASEKKRIDKHGQRREEQGMEDDDGRLLQRPHVVRRSRMTPVQAEGGLTRHQADKPSRLTPPRGAWRQPGRGVRVQPDPSLAPGPTSSPDQHEPASQRTSHHYSALGPLQTSISRRPSPARFLLARSHQPASQRTQRPWSPPPTTSPGRMAPRSLAIAGPDHRPAPPLSPSPLQNLQQRRRQRRWTRARPARSSSSLSCRRPRGHTTTRTRTTRAGSRACPSLLLAPAAEAAFVVALHRLLFLPRSLHHLHVVGDLVARHPPAPSSPRQHRRFRPRRTITPPSLLLAPASSPHCSSPLTTPPYLPQSVHPTRASRPPRTSPPPPMTLSSGHPRMDRPC